MASRYLDETDPESPSHAAGSPGGCVVEVTDPALWCREQMALREWFLATAARGFVPPGAPIDRLARYLGHVHKLEVGRGGTDFRYRIYGNLIAGEANMQMQDRWVSELPEPTGDIILTHYARLLRRPRLFVGELRYDGDDLRHPVWLRADAPVGSPEDGMIGIVVLTLPRELATFGPSDEGGPGDEDRPDAEGPPSPDGPDRTGL